MTTTMPRVTSPVAPGRTETETVDDYPIGHWINCEYAHNDMVAEIRTCPDEGTMIDRKAFRELARGYGTMDDFRELMNAYGSYGDRRVPGWALERLKGGDAVRGSG